jgi:hypothetical protein
MSIFKCETGIDSTSQYKVIFINKVGAVRIYVITHEQIMGVESQKE